MGKETGGGGIPDLAQGSTQSSRTQVFLISLLATPGTSQVPSDLKTAAVAPSIASSYSSIQRREKEVTPHAALLRNESDLCQESPAGFSLQLGPERHGVFMPKPSWPRRE